MLLLNIVVKSELGNETKTKPDQGRRAQAGFGSVYRSCCRINGGVQLIPGVAEVRMLGRVSGVALFVVLELSLIHI